MSEFSVDSARATVREMYQVVLGREPEDEGLAHHAKALCNGMSVGLFVQSLLASHEYETRELQRLRTALIEREGLVALQSVFPVDYAPPGEAGRSYQRRRQSGFFDKYCKGDLVLDVGFSGYDNPAGLAALPDAIGIDLDFPGYDGIRLPFEDGSVDCVFSSHCLEHILADHAALRDWYRVLKVGGFIVCLVPHQGLYEKKKYLPSRFNGDHKRFYTPSSLLRSVEEALTLNSYRIRHLCDNDEGFNYNIAPETHSDGAYEIELVIEKIEKPDWDIL
jgi:SAM-dependent methyltransferase